MEIPMLRFARGTGRGAYRQLLCLFVVVLSGCSEIPGPSEIPVTPNKRAANPQIDFFSTQPLRAVVVETADAAPGIAADGKTVRIALKLSERAPDESEPRMTVAREGVGSQAYATDVTFSANRDSVIGRFGEAGMRRWLQMISPDNSARLQVQARAVTYEACEEAYDLLRSPSDPSSSSTGTIIVFVHGLQMEDNCDEWSGFDPHTKGTAVFEHLNLIGMSELTDYFIYTYATFNSIETAAADLEARLRESAAGQRVVFVGHSMGGLVARRATQLLAGSDVIVTRIVTLGTPHTGTEAARRLFWTSLAGLSLWPLRTDGVADLRPRSAFLDNLNSSDDRARVHTITGTLSGIDPACGLGPLCLLIDFASGTFALIGKQSDGFVPQSSAELSACTAYGGKCETVPRGQRHTFAGYNHFALHEGMHGGSSPDPVLEKVASIVSEAVGIAALRRLAFAMEPPTPLFTDAYYGARWGTPVRVRILDGNGDLVITASDSITISYATAPLGASLTEARAKAVNGVAHFPNLRIWTNQHAMHSLRARGTATSTIRPAVSMSFQPNPLPVVLHMGSNPSSFVVVDSTFIAFSSGKVVKTRTDGAYLGELFNPDSSNFLAIESDGANAYVLDGVGPTIWKVPLSGAPPTILTTGFRYYGPHLIYDNGFVYYTDAVGWREGTVDTTVVIRRLSVNGGSARIIATLPVSRLYDAVDFAVSGGNLYYSHNSAIRVMNRSGGTATTLATGVGPFDAPSLVITKGRIYWSAGNQLMMVPVSGGVASSIRSCDSCNLWPVAGDGAFLFVFEGSHVRRGMWRHKLDDGSWQFTGIGDGTGVAFDDRSIYFRWWGGHGYAPLVRRASKLYCDEGC